MILKPRSRIRKKIEFSPFLPSICSKPGWSNLVQHRIVVPFSSPIFIKGNNKNIELITP